jgi:hypothetical protein
LNLFRVALISLRRKICPTASTILNSSLALSPLSIDDDQSDVSWFNMIISLASQIDSQFTVGGSDWMIGVDICRPELFGTEVFLQKLYRTLHSFLGPLCRFICDGFPFGQIVEAELLDISQKDILISSWICTAVSKGVQ